MHYAVKARNPHRVKQLAELGVDINWKDAQQMTPLHHAVLEQDCNVIKTLVKLGAHLNATDQTGRTPAALAHDRGF